MTSPLFGVIEEIEVSAQARVYEEGWQSWSPTAWYPATAARSARPDEPWQHRMRFRTGHDLPAGGFQGEGLLVVDPGAGAPVRVFGSTDVVAVPAIRANLAGDRLVITADGPVASWTATGAGQALAEFGAALAAAGGGGRLRPAPTAWCTWYRYFEDVTEADVLENLQQIRALDLPVDVIQIDDGWATGVGDWTTLAPGFTSLVRLAATIRAADLRAGIWIAPFTVGSRSALAAEHPDWLVGAGGANWNQDLHGLDLTHPGACAYLWQVLRTLREVGFDYVKLDFLYTGALPGRRHQELTPTEAYRSGLELVRDAVGPETFLLGCGAPILPSVGLVDAMRVSPDTFHEGAQDGSAGLRGAPGALARAWQHGRLWTNDADCFVGRPSFAQRVEWAGVIERCGGLRSASDRITELDDWGLSTTRRLLSRAPGPEPFASQGDP